jgi:hypothetical protein
MGPQPKVLFRCFVTLLVLFAAASSFGLAQINDSNQDQTYGVWKVPNPQTPGIQFRAKCNQDITDSQGRTLSEWSIQFRSTYKGTIDFIYLNEAGIAEPPANKMIGPFLDTLKPGETYENGAQLYGGCSQHRAPTTGIHVAIKCAVPTGQDAPCFKDATGNPYPRAESNDEPTAASAVRTDAHPYRYYYCAANTLDQTKEKPFYFVKPFEKDADWNVLTTQFAKWVARNHPEIGNNSQVGCVGFETLEAAEKAESNAKALAEQGGFVVSMISWSPK